MTGGEEGGGRSIACDGRFQVHLHLMSSGAKERHPYNTPSSQPDLRELVGRAV